MGAVWGGRAGVQDAVIVRTRGHSMLCPYMNWEFVARAPASLLRFLCYDGSPHQAPFRSGAPFPYGEHDEGFAQGTGGAGTFTGKDSCASDWADRCAGARPDGVDLRDRPTYIWMGSVVPGADQAAGDAWA